LSWFEQLASAGLRPAQPRSALSAKLVAMVYGWLPPATKSSMPTTAMVCGVDVGGKVRAKRVAVRDSNRELHGILAALTATRKGRALSRATTQVLFLPRFAEGNSELSRSSPSTPSPPASSAAA
jgi:hypothetical protein